MSDIADIYGGRMGEGMVRTFWTPCTLPFDDDRPTTGFLLKIYHFFKQTMIEPNIWSSF
jgi:hypothetical protein